MKVNLTSTQQQWLTHIEAAHQSGLPYSDYARKNGLNVDALFNAKYVLRKKGVIVDNRQVTPFVKAEPKPNSPTPTVSLQHRIDITLTNGVQVSIAADRTLMAELTKMLLQS